MNLPLKTTMSAVICLLLLSCAGIPDGEASCPPLPKFHSGGDSDPMLDVFAGLQRTDIPSQIQRLHERVKSEDLSNAYPNFSGSVSLLSFAISDRMTSLMYQYDNVSDVIFVIEFDEAECVAARGYFGMT